ncbi:Fbox domain containing protein [Acanthamoeba castellanii str. Neff]|uniref:Fbox domain containing protein n=1 Tax=Acanthamoeba castellanii (strain ATCC 30010 / Neff) TaxID=1257118 RepID=L8GLG7_ACACF|nr:Fbox domain containing protein [Acanthamoeba castellanii str. Neff]ELR13041.1 Fbox domain containing protein [Acanthamoeba castellanii str. Neff]
MDRAVWAAASESQRQERLKKEEEDKQLEAARAAEHAAHIARLCATPPPDGLPDLLPEELWVRILQHLPMRSWKNVARVCVFLRRIAQDQMVDPVVLFRRKREEARLRLQATALG